MKKNTILCHIHACIVYKSVTPPTYTSPYWLESERNMVRFCALFLKPPVTDTGTLGAQQSQMHLARLGDPLCILHTKHGNQGILFTNARDSHRAQGTCAPYT
jgi:hypothetical protein